MEEEEEAFEQWWVDAYPLIRDTFLPEKTASRWEGPIKRIAEQAFKAGARHESWRRAKDGTSELIY